MYNLIKYSDNYYKTSGTSWKYCRDVPAVNDDDESTDFTKANATTDYFNLKVKLTGQTDDNGPKNVEVLVPLRYLIHVWRTLEMPLIDCEINLDLNWSENCVIVATNIAAQAITFSITDTKQLYFLQLKVMQNFLENEYLVLKNNQPE